MLLWDVIASNRQNIPSEDADIILTLNLEDEFLRKTYYTIDEVVKQHNDTQKVVNLLVLHQCGNQR